MHEGRTEDRMRVHLVVRGIVQGVGFRPFVYNLARRSGISGFVLNSAFGAVIEAEGESAEVEAFVLALRAEAPPLARIVAVESTAMELLGDANFLIQPSVADSQAFTPMPPDIAVCAQCLAEVRDEGNRRFAYPFANCTNCGPRYSIIRDIPYDRPMTTMAEFVMCAKCRAEYEDPADRRFHAQPNACAVCGPRLRLVVSEEPEEFGGDAASTLRVLARVAEMLEQGKIVAWKGLGGYQLACDARQSAAVTELRGRKHRSEKAFAVMVESVEVVASLCVVSAPERAALEHWGRPIVLLERRADSGLAEEVSPQNPLTGMMLPSTPMHDLLFGVLRKRGSDAPAALVMTSGNVSDEPIVTDAVEAEARLAGIADAFVHHDRNIHNRVDDSIVRVFADAPRVLRRARGFAPGPVWLANTETQVLACGAQQKSTFCLTRAGFGLMSQHLGDLENYETLEFYEQTLKRMQRLFHVLPTVVAHDLHPDYMSTKLALGTAADKKFAVQHHHAHVVSCMAEHGLDGQVLGVAWDGTGLGTDGTIWGGEFLIADRAECTRFAHLRNVLLAGGDRAVKEPWRVARSYLRDAFGTEIPALVRPRVEESKVALLDAMLTRRVSTVETSSAGRLFDAVAAIVGLRDTVSFEGQAAMLLEFVSAREENASYEFALRGDQNGNGQLEVDLRPMVRQIVEDRTRGVTSAVIASRFHNTLVQVVVQVCGRMRESSGLARVCLSGGCFQNLRLLQGVVNDLRGIGFEVYFHSQVPANDGGIALGQAAIACELVARGR
jgi:hydrogenase maturation protein HypF